MCEIWVKRAISEKLKIYLKIERLELLIKYVKNYRILYEYRISQFKKNI